MSFPNNNDAPDSEISREAREILSAIPHGRENARTAAEIAERAGISSTDATNPGVRRVIKEVIIEKMKRPVGSCNDGFFMIQTREALEDCLDDYTSRIRGIEKKMAILKEAYAEYHSTDEAPQRTLF